MGGRAPQSPQSPQVGYNTNVRHHGKLYHLQTEDSGIKNPNVTTHIFVDGGRVLATRKTNYAEDLEKEDLPERVKILMRTQHKAMFIELRDGVHDVPGETAALSSPEEQVETTPGMIESPPIEEPLARRSAPATEPAPPPTAGVPRDTHLDLAPPIPPPSKLPSIAPSTPPSMPTAPAAAREWHSTPAAPPEDRDSSLPLGIYRNSTDARARDTAESRKGDSQRDSLDMDALERAASKVPETLVPPSMQRGRGVPQPPKSVRPRPLGVHGRYQVSRGKPESILPPPTPKSAKKSAVFGNELVSEKSLDEVILAFLAEDHDE